MLSGLIVRIRSSISAKIALVVTLPVVVITSLFAYHHYSHDRDTTFHNAEAQLLRIGEGMLGPIGTFLRNDDAAGLDDLVAQSARGADIEHILLLNSARKVVASNQKDWNGRDLSNLVPGTLTANDHAALQKAFAGGYSIYFDPLDEQYCMVMPVSVDGRRSGVLFISLDLASMTAGLRREVWEGVLLSVIVSLAIGVSIYFLFHYLLVRRIKAVTEAATTFAVGDVQARANIGGTDEIAYLATSFNLLAEEITNWRSNLEEIAAGRMNELLVLFDIVNTISQSLDLRAVLPNVLETVVRNMGVTKGAIVLVGKDGRTLGIGAQLGLCEESLRLITELGQGGAGDVILRNKTLRLEGEEENDFVPGLDKDDIRSALVVPISARGSILGALAVYCVNRDKFTENDEALLATIGNQVSVAVLNARLYERTLELAQIDGLTGLSNRRHLMERLNQEVIRAERYHTSLSVLMLDLDKFKSFNDAYGHLKGDELLRAFSSMIAKSIRSTDLAGRYGGEEFCVVLPNTSVRGAAVIAERIRAAMEALTIPMAEGEPPAGRTVSIGAAEFVAGQTMEQLVAVADAALYRAKEGGRNRVVWE